MATIEGPIAPMQQQIMIEHAVTTMCTSCIIQDETMRVTYIDTVTASMGRVAFGSSCLMAYASRSTLEDITNLP